MPYHLSYFSSTLALGSVGALGMLLRWPCGRSVTPPHALRCSSKILKYNDYVFLAGGIRAMFRPSITARNADEAEPFSPDHPVQRSGLVR